MSATRSEVSQMMKEHAKRMEFRYGRPFKHRARVKGYNRLARQRRADGTVMTALDMRRRSDQLLNMLHEAES